MHHTYQPGIRPSLCLYPIRSRRADHSAHPSARLCRPHHLHIGAVALPRVGFGILLSTLRAAYWLPESYSRCSWHLGRRLPTAALPPHLPLSTGYGLLAIRMGTDRKGLYLLTVGSRLQRKLFGFIIVRPLAVWYSGSHVEDLGDASKAKGAAGMHPASGHCVSSGRREVCCENLKC